MIKTDEKSGVEDSVGMHYTRYCWWRLEKQTAVVGGRTSDEQGRCRVGGAAILGTRIYQVAEPLLHAVNKYKQYSFGCLLFPEINNQSLVLHYKKVL